MSLGNWRRAIDAIFLPVAPQAQLSKIEISVSHPSDRKWVLSLTPDNFTLEVIGKRYFRSYFYDPSAGIIYGHDRVLRPHQFPRFMNQFRSFLRAYSLYSVDIQATIDKHMPTKIEKNLPSGFLEPLIRYLTGNANRIVSHLKHGADSADSPRGPGDTIKVGQIN